MSLRLVFVTAAALMAAPTIARAEWPQLLQMTPSSSALHSAPDGAGGAYFAWSDGGAVRALRIDALGAAENGWPASGVAVHNFGGNPARTAPGPENSLYVAWVNGYGTWLQRLDSNGQVAPGWPAGGWDFSTFVIPGGGAYPVFELAPDGQGGVYVAWSKDYTRVTRIQPDGTPYPGWLAAGKIVTSADLPFTMTPDGAGGVFLAYIGGDRVNVQRRDPAGAIVAAWQSDLLGADGWDELIRVAADGAGGVVVSWSWTEAAVIDPHTAVTRLQADLTPASGWPAGGGWKSLDSSGAACAASVHVDASGSIFVPWVSAADWGLGQIRVTRWLPDGSLPPGWTEGGFPLPGLSENCGYIESNGNFALPAFLPDDAGGLYFAYRNASGALRMNRIDDQGALAVNWPLEGALLRGDVNHRDLTLVPDGTGGVTASWRVFEAAAAEAQHVNADGTLGPPPVVGVPEPAMPGMLTISLPRPNPARHAVEFSLQLAEPAPTRVAVFDLQGRLVRHIAGGAVLGPGVHDFRWNLEDGTGGRVRPGLYLVRAVTGAATSTRSLIVTE